MIKRRYCRSEKSCRTMRTLSLCVALLVMFPLSVHAKNDLLTLPAFKSEKAPHSLLLDIAKTGKRLVAVGERGHILTSDDNGTSWRQVDSPTSVTLTAVYFPTPETGWAVGHDAIVLHTSDGGDSWAVQLNGFDVNKLNVVLAKKMLTVMEAELADATENEKEARTDELEDLRYHLESMQIAVDDGVCCDPLLDVWFKNDKEGFVLGAYGMFFHTNDGGASWIPWWDRIENPDRFHLSAFAGTNEVLYIAGEAGMLFRSMDSGKSWEHLETPYEGSYLGIIASQENDYAIAFGIGGKMIVSIDQGESWNMIQAKAGAALSGGIVRENGEALIVSYSGVVLTGAGDKGVFTPKKIGVGWNSVVDTGDGYVVLVGLKGAKRIPFDSANSGE